ncbi:MAG: hypothetical protein HYZ37_17165 [Candidatus Solibacter usitatus]|nr:hypothetical protein [Candidatus Solibacter usitatus]
MKGRLPLPSAILSYLKALQAKQVFITTIDITIGRIYTIPAWDKTLELLASAEGEDQERATRVMFMANHFGQDVEVDSADRVLLPTELRRHLSLEGATVHLEAGAGFVNIYSDDLYQANYSAYRPQVADDVKALRKKIGLK